MLHRGIIKSYLKYEFDTKRKIFTQTEVCVKIFISILV